VPTGYLPPFPGSHAYILPATTKILRSLNLDRPGKASSVLFGLLSFLDFSDDSPSFCVLFTQKAFRCLIGVACSWRGSFLVLCLFLSPHWSPAFSFPYLFRTPPLCLQETPASDFVQKDGTFPRVVPISCFDQPPTLRDPSSSVRTGRVIVPLFYAGALSPFPFPSAWWQFQTSS